MSIRFKCPECGIFLRASEDMVGRDIRCGVCFAVFPVPTTSEESREEPREDHEERREEADEPREERPRRRTRRDPDDPDRDRDDGPRPVRGYDRDRDRDDDGEPRPRTRRRRRRPPQPAGKGPLFWIAIVFGVILLGSCAVCGGGYLMLPGEQWRTYQSPRGGYSAELPLEPDQNMQLAGMKPEPGTHTEGGILWKNGECYAVMYGDILPRHQRALSDEQLLQEAVKGMSTDREVRRVTVNKPVTVSGFPAREVEFLGTDGGTYTARVVVADRRVYVVIGGGRFVRPGNQNIRRFIDSFKVNDPSLKKPNAND